MQQAAATTTCQLLGAGEPSRHGSPEVPRLDVVGVQRQIGLFHLPVVRGFDGGRGEVRLTVELFDDVLLGHDPRGRGGAQQTSRHKNPGRPPRRLHHD